MGEKMVRNLSKGATRNNDAWLDNLEFGDESKGEPMRLYGAKVNPVIVAIALASKTSPESIIKLAKELEPIKRELLKQK